MYFMDSGKKFDEIVMSNDYNIIIGGGLGGAALTGSLAHHSIRVLVLEREITFHNRV